MTHDEVLAKATPRPWRISDRVGGEGRTNKEAEVSSEHGPYWVAHCQHVEHERIDANANADMIVTAVNAYERQREALLRVIDSPRESDKWLTEIYAAAGVERPATLREYQQRTPASAYEGQRAVIKQEGK